MQVLKTAKRQAARVYRFLARIAGREHTGSPAVADVRRKLYTEGFLERGFADLHELATAGSNKSVRREASWELALWHANQQTPADAASCLRLLDGGRGWHRQRSVVLRAECLAIIGEVEQAKAVLSRELERQETDDLLLAYGNLCDRGDRLWLLNKVFTRNGLSPVTLCERTGITVLEALRPQEGNRTRQTAGDAPRVTVIVPAFNCEDTVHIALEALLAQTWPNLEILVVDDCSTDKSAATIQGFAEMDHRLRLIKSEVNRGPYVSQNIAIQDASGEFVTCHGADDWAHPERIAIQAEHLCRNPDCVGNLTELVRVDDDLRCFRRGHPGYYVHTNLSLMFRRMPVLDRVGYWDSIRFGGDVELLRRMRRAFGDEKIARLKKGPLVFARQADSSLTGNAKFGYPGYLRGARKEHFDAYNSFLNAAKSFRVEFPQTQRRYAVPEPMWPEREDKVGGTRRFDVILASDFRFRAGNALSNLQEIRAQKTAGLRTGLIQMNVYNFPDRPVYEAVRDEIDGDKLQMLVYGEEVECDLLIIRYPPVLQEFQKFLPTVRAREIRVIINQPPMRDYSGGAERVYDLENCQRNLVRLFGKEGVWAPIGPLVREAILKEPNADVIDLAETDWYNIIDIGDWYTGTRRCTGPKPVIGRHSRDTAIKWPDNARDLLDAYPDDEEFSVKILGGARAVEDLLGRVPKNWQVFAFNSKDPRQFLSEIDVFVYFHHKGWVEAFGRAPMEAMAAGLPVILPECFRPLFKDAAIYAEPADVRKVAMSLFRDQTWYRERSEISRRYVEENFGHALHIKRISPYLATKREA